MEPLIKTIFNIQIPYWYRHYVNLTLTRLESDKNVIFRLCITHLYKIDLDCCGDDLFYNNWHIFNILKYKKRK